MSCFHAHSMCSQCFYHLESSADALRLALMAQDYLVKDTNREFVEAVVGESKLNYGSIKI